MFEQLLLLTSLLSLIVLFVIELIRFFGEDEDSIDQNEVNAEKLRNVYNDYGCTSTTRDEFYNNRQQERYLNSVLKDNEEMKRELSKRKSSNSSQFTKSELRAISILCHPDKHRGGHSELALETSKKINSIKD